MRLRLLVPALLLGLVASACSSGESGSRTTYTSGSGSAGYRAAAPAPVAPMAVAAPSRGRSGNTALVFVAGWCGYCKKLERNTLSDPSVQAELASLNWQKVDPDSASGKPLARQYGVTGFPTTVVVNSSGGVVKKIVGYNAPNDYLPQLRQAH